MGDTALRNAPALYMTTLVDSDPYYAQPERFKTRAAQFAILRDERTGMHWATLGKSGSEAVL